MELKKIFKSSEGVNIVVQISPIERLALSFVFGDVCEQKRRMIELKHLIDNLNLFLALYSSKTVKHTNGCLTIIHSTIDFWQRILELCKQKGLVEEELCALHVVNIISSFLEVIALYTHV